MTLEELKTVLAGTNLPVAYLAFPADDPPNMPFLVYEETGSDNFGADNIVYTSAMMIQVTLFTIKKSRSTEILVENALTNAGIYWERTSSYEDDEHCYMTIYDLEIGG